MSQYECGEICTYTQTVLDLGQIVKNSIEKEGMIGWQFNTIGVSDAITMGGEGE